MMIRTALILATDETGLQPVFGIPAVRRLVLQAFQIGLRSVRVVSRQGSIIPVLSDLISPDAFHLITNLEELKGILRIVDLGEGERVLLLRSNHVIDRWSLARFVHASDGEGIRTLTEDGTTSIGGIFIAGKREVLPLVAALWSPDSAERSILDRAQPLKVVRGLPCLVGTDDRAGRIPEDRLIAALPFATRERDGFLARHVDRPLSRLISGRLARTGVTPNQITLFNVAIGFAGAFFLSRGSYWSQLAGSFFFLLCVVLDGVDGEVARLKLKESVFGHYLDIITDNLVHIAIFVGIAIGLWHETGDRRYLYALGFLLGGFGLCAFVIHGALSRGPDAARSRITSKLTGLLANRDFAYLIVACAIAGLLAWFLLAAAAGSYLFAATLWVLDTKAVISIAP
jgi:phosphatidylglycerophosphate synthase